MLLAKGPRPDECEAVMSDPNPLVALEIPEGRFIEGSGEPWVRHRDPAFLRWFYTQNQSWERAALLLSVNHSGDSDSTGIVCGNIAGALYGVRAIPPEWLATLELRELVETLAKDALVEFSPGPPTDPGWTRRYPAW
jgi:hypothetical protein